MKSSNLLHAGVRRPAFLALALCLLLATSVSAPNVVLYDYGSSAGSGFTLLQPRPTNNADFGTFGLTLAPGQSFQVSQITVARAHSNQTAAST